MNRVLSLIAVIAACFVSNGRATGYAWTNNTTVEMGNQNTLDYENILNLGQFFVTTNLNSSDYYFYNVLNYTNRNLMYANYGFTFDRTPSGSGPIRMASNFFNAPLVTNGNCRIYGGVDINIWATNVTNKGIIEANLDKIVIKGQNVDLSEGTLRITATTNLSASTAGSQLYDRYWAATNYMSLLISSNLFWSVDTLTPVTQVINGVRGTNFNNFTLTNPASYAYTKQPNVSNIFKTVVFINNSNPAVKVDVRFQTNGQFSFATPTVQLSNAVVNSSGKLLTNVLYITDSLGNGPMPVGFPFNYSISSFPFGFTNGAASNAVISPQLFGFPPFANFIIEPDGQSTAYQVELNPLSFDPTALSQGTSVANQPGRIEVRANNLTMNNTRIDSLNYLVLQATNNFTGGSNLVSVPYSDFNLATTNDTLRVTNLLASYLPRMAGTLTLWSGRWTNVDNLGVTNYYHVVLVDSRIEPKFPTKVNNLSLSATNTYLSDVMNVQSNLVMTAQKFTITTNALAGFGGELNIQTPFISVSSAFPNLQYFTNYGRFSTIGVSAFGEPLSLQAFVNRGGIDVEGISVNTAVFEDTGLLLAKNAGCFIQAGYAGITNGAVISQNGDVSVKSGVLYAKGSTIYSQHSLTLDVTQRLDDLGGLNSWECHDGFNFLAHPSTGDLFGTTLANVVFDNSQSISSSAIADRGPIPASFTNSATIGHLTLDGGANGQVVFTGTGDSKALYIDYLELKNNATNPGTLFIDNNITLYVGAAGPVSPEKLNLIYPRLVWVPTFQGPNSTTNVLLRNGQTIAVNLSVPGSSTLDSDGDGVPNSIDPFPFDGLQVSAVTNAGLQTVAISWYADSASWEYDIDYSTDLVAWTPLASVFSGPSAGQLMTFQDSLSSGVRRYYRVRTLSH